MRIPNGSVYGNALTNYTDTKKRRMDLACGVSYGDDLEKSRTVALDAMKQVAHRDTSRDPEFFYEEFGGSSINFKVRVWLEEGPARRSPPGRPFVAGDGRSTVPAEVESR